MTCAAFKIAFGHPFGSHGRKTREHIVERKRGEISANGWTRWSFQYRRPQVLAVWHRELLAAGGPSAFVFCSDSAGAVDPADAGVPVARPTAEATGSPPRTGGGRGLRA